MIANHHNYWAICIQIPSQYSIPKGTIDRHSLGGSLSGVQGWKQLNMVCAVLLLVQVQICYNVESGILARLGCWITEARKRLVEMPKTKDWKELLDEEEWSKRWKKGRMEKWSRNGCKWLVVDGLSLKNTPSQVDRIFASKFKSLPSLLAFGLLGAVVPISAKQGSAVKC